MQSKRYGKDEEMSEESFDNDSSEEEEREFESEDHSDQDQE